MLTAGVLPEAAGRAIDQPTVMSGDVGRWQVAGFPQPGERFRLGLGEVARWTPSEDAFGLCGRKHRMVGAEQVPQPLRREDGLLNLPYYEAIPEPAEAPPT